MTDQEEMERFLRWMRGDAAAARFCYEWMFIVHLWDDLIDKDKERSDQDINDAFQSLFSLPTNTFYAANFHLLYPVIMSAIHSFYICNQFEKGMTEADLDIAYGTRCNVLNVLVVAADIVGGTKWATHVGQEIWRAGLSQPLQDYKEELRCQT